MIKITTMNNKDLSVCPICKKRPVLESRNAGNGEYFCIIHWNEDKSLNIKMYAKELVAVIRLWEQCKDRIGTYTDDKGKPLHADL